MNLKLRLKNVKGSEFVNKFIENEANKVSKYFDGRFTIDCSCEKREDGHKTLVRILGPNFHYHAKGKNENLVKSIFTAFEKISRQLDKKKQKTRNKIKRSNLRTPKHSQIFKLVRNEERVISEIEEIAA